MKAVVAFSVIVQLHRLIAHNTIQNSLRNKVSSVQQLLLLIGSLQPRHALRQFLRIFKWQTTEIISKENGINDNVSQFQFLLKLVTDFFVSLV